MKKYFTILMMVLCFVAFSTGDAQAKKRRTFNSYSSSISDGYYEGDVGGSRCYMTLSGNRGYYSMSYDNATRVLKRVSNGVYKAYKGGRFIGTFRGSINYGSSYTGRFYNPKGASSPFYLNLCGAND